MLGISLGGRPIDLSQPLDISVPVLEGKITCFGLPYARKRAFFELQIDNSTGCQCDEITFCPHTHGTHVESIAHVSNTAVRTIDIVRELPPLLLAKLVDIHDLDSSHQEGAGEGIQALLVRDGWLDLVLSDQQPGGKGLELDKLEAAPPFINNERMREILNRYPMVQILGFDSISIDPVKDSGLLEGHQHFFYGIGGGVWSDLNGLLMEFCRLKPSIPSGIYALALNAAALDSDAIPCRPVLYPFLPPT